MSTELDRRGFLKLTGAGALSAALPGCVSHERAEGREKPRRRPNFLILLTDDQRYDTIGALGNPAIRTPNMNRLVRRQELSIRVVQKYLKSILRQLLLKRKKKAT